jgi:hypothetical protein
VLLLRGGRVAGGIVVVAVMSVLVLLQQRAHGRASTSRRLSSVVDWSTPLSSLSFASFSPRARNGLEFAFLFVVVVAVKVRERVIATSRNGQAPG